MKKKSSMSKTAYWIEIVALMILLGIVFYFWGFRNCFALDRKGSLILFLIMDVVLTVGLAVWASLYTKNNVSIWCSVIMPLEIYIVASYLTLQTGKIMLVLAVWILSVIIWLLFKSHNATGKEKEYRIKDNIPQLIRVAWILMVLSYLLFLLPIMYRGAKGIEVSLDYTLTSTDKSGLTITGQMEALSKVDDSNWRKLSREKRQELLQLVANVEANMLGLSHDIYIGIRDFGETQIRSCYTAADYKILIDENAIDTFSGYELVEMVCHQAYHAYERDLVNLYMNTDRAYQGLQSFSVVKNYVAELQKNIEALDDRTEAERENLEADATSYSQTQAAEYKKWIQFWISSNE